MKAPRLRGFLAQTAVSFTERTHKRASVVNRDRNVEVTKQREHSSCGRTEGLIDAIIEAIEVIIVAIGSEL